MCRLVHIPIIHTSADLGSLSASVQAHYTRVCGGTNWTEREQVIQALWTDIQRNLDALHLEGPRTRIYQDGLPICGFEERIVRELANAGSSNHQLILRLLDQGAILMGTEDPQLLMEEYELQKRCFPERTGGEKMGTGISPGTDSPRFAEAGSEPLPIFSPARAENAANACWKPVIGSLRSGLPLRSKKARWGCCSWAACTAWMR